MSRPKNYLAMVLANAATKFVKNATEPGIAMFMAMLFGIKG
jgi:hypothetical protein